MARSIDSRDNRLASHAAPSAAVRVVPIPKPLPADYAILNSRSFFYHGKLPPPPDPNYGGDRGPSNTAIPTSRPEKSLLFNGSTKSDGEWMALIEDTRAGRIVKVYVGDALAQGHVSAISLDTLDYDVAGRTRLILLGQNLDGDAIAGPTSRPAPDGATPASGPSPDGALGDMLEKLRQKRLRELGGK